jgi:hypothetical protein
VFTDTEPTVSLDEISPDGTLNPDPATLPWSNARSKPIEDLIKAMRQYKATPAPPPMTFNPLVAPNSGSPILAPAGVAPGPPIRSGTFAGNLIFDNATAQFVADESILFQQTIRAYMNQTAAELDVPGRLLS